MGRDRPPRPCRAGRACWPDATDNASSALGEERRYHDIVLAICKRHRLKSDFQRFPEGGKPVFRVGQRYVIKLFPPSHRAHCECEHRTLHQLEETDWIATPRVLEAGEIEDCTYLVLSCLPGQTLRAAWRDIPPPDRIALACRLGETMAALHALPTEQWGVFLDAPDWQAFGAAQRETCVERQAAHRTPARWLSQLPAYLDSITLPCERRVLLHTEMMREHVLVTHGDNGWRISGVVDFERMMIGAPEYDFAAVGLFVSEGDADFLRALLTAYGYAPEELTSELRERFLGYALLHRYSNLRWFLEHFPYPAGTKHLSELAAYWWRT